MGTDSKIAWTDHTFSPYWGCHKVSAGCDQCYAHGLSVRLGYAENGTKKVKLWGVDGARRAASERTWEEPYKWQREAMKKGRRYRVFCASMADVFEDSLTLKRADAAQVIRDAQARLWPLILDTPNLDWQMLTKRPENIMRTIPQDWALCGLPDNVWIGTTAENQEMYDKRWPILAAVPAAVHFVSYEPALGPLRLRPAHMQGDGKTVLGHPPAAPDGGVYPDWLIVGGESGRNARPFASEWAEALLQQCDVRGVRLFVKQMGSYLVSESRTAPLPDGCSAEDIAAWRRRGLLASNGEMWAWRAGLESHSGADPAEWEEHLRVQQFPTSHRTAG